MGKVEECNHDWLGHLDGADVPPGKIKCTKCRTVIDQDDLIEEKAKLPAPWQTFVKDFSPDIHDAEGQNAILMHFCNQGWELINVQGRFAYFKRVNREWIAREEARQRRRQR